MSTPAVQVKATHPEFGTGRLYAPDTRDFGFLARNLKPEVVEPVTKSRYWRTAAALNQGTTPMCVAYSLETMLIAAPSMHMQLPSQLPPDRLYHQAQLDDEWAGENYDGTSVRGGCKALQDWGLLTQYLWLTSAQEVAAAIAHHGPVVVGTNWYNSMFTPDPKSSVLTVDRASGIAGGHAYCLIGYNLQHDMYRILNSWGTSWGQKGRVWLKGSDLQFLLEEQGEAVLVTELGGKNFDAAVGKIPPA